MRKILCITLALVLMLSVVAACAKDEAPAPTPTPAPTVAPDVEQTEDKSEVETTFEDGPFGKYPEEITVTFSKSTSEGDNWKWEHLNSVGETLEDNRYTRLFKDELNINVEYLWVVDDSQYIQKARLAISAGDLPDSLRLPIGTGILNMHTDLMQMAEFGQSMYMDDLWEEYASPLSKDIANDENGLIMRALKYDGKMAGIPEATGPNGSAVYFWVRTDWMEELGLEPPTTIDEMTAYVQTCVDADMGNNGKTYAFMVDKLLWSQLDGVFGAYGAYPRSWIEDADGNLAWGPTFEEMIPGLEMLQDYYSRGWIDPEFIVKEFDIAREVIAAGQVALGYYHHWFTHVALNMLKENEPDSDWASYDLPMAIDSNPKYRAELPLRGAHAININCEHPEAIIKILNMYNEVNFGPNADYEYYSSPTINGVLVNDIWGALSPIPGLFNIDVLSQRIALPAMKGETDPAELTGVAKQFYENVQNDWTWLRMFGPGDTPGEQFDKHYLDPDTWLKADMFVGAPTPTMIERWSQITELRDTYVTRIITGDLEPEAGFYEFVDNFYSMGGDKVTEEVNEWYQINK